MIMECHIFFPKLRNDDCRETVLVTKSFPSHNVLLCSEMRNWWN